MRCCCIDAEYDSRYEIDLFEKKLAEDRDECLREVAPPVFREVPFDYPGHNEHRGGATLLEEQ